MFLSAAIAFLSGYVHERVEQQRRARELAETASKVESDARDLVAAYEDRLNAVRRLTDYARKRKASVDTQLLQAVEGGDKPDVGDGDGLRAYLRDQVRVSEKTRRLIADLDVDLGAPDREFQGLVREFTDGELSSSKILESFNRRRERVRSLATGPVQNWHRLKRYW